MSGKPLITITVIRELGHDAFELSSKRDEIFGTQRVYKSRFYLAIGKVIIM